MRHAKAEELKGIAQLLAGIRRVKGIKERGNAHFYFKGRSAIHFHVDADGAIYADIGSARMPAKGMHGQIMKALKDYMAKISK